MPLQSVVNTDSQHDIYRVTDTGKRQISYQPRVAAYLTESGTVTLTKGSSDNRGYGSAPGSEGDQGNTGGIAASTRYGFGMLADITLQVENNPNFQLEPKYETVAENGGQVKAGDKLTISIPTLPIEQLAQDYKLHMPAELLHQHPRCEYIFSKWLQGRRLLGGRGHYPRRPRGGAQEHHLYRAQDHPGRAPTEFTAAIWMLPTEAAAMSGWMSMQISIRWRSAT